MVKLNKSFGKKLGRNGCRIFYSLCDFSKHRNGTKNSTVSLDHYNLFD